VALRDEAWRVLGRLWLGLGWGVVKARGHAFCVRFTWLGRPVGGKCWGKARHAFVKDNGWLEKLADMHGSAGRLRYAGICFFSCRGAFFFLFHLTGLVCNHHRPPSGCEAGLKFCRHMLHSNAEYEVISSIDFGAAVCWPSSRSTRRAFALSWYGLKLGRRGRRRRA
jgi:hypothetical protein